MRDFHILKFPTLATKAGLTTILPPDDDGYNFNDGKIISAKCGKFGAYSNLIITVEDSACSGQIQRLAHAFELVDQKYLVFTKTTNAFWYRTTTGGAFSDDGPWAYGGSMTVTIDVTALVAAIKAKGITTLPAAP
jgi:hypothetical protein